MPENVKINIKNIATGGAGVGIVNMQDEGEDLLGITAFVPFSARGEYLSARVVERKKNYILAELTELIESSEHRVMPKCPVFGLCGGCELQHINYKEQLNSKLEMIKGSLRAAKLPSTDIEKVKDIVASSPYNYRRRITLHIDSGGKIGFYRNNTRSVIPISNCPISVSAIDENLGKLKDFGERVAGIISSVLLETDMEGMIAVLKSPYDLDKQKIKLVLEEAKKVFKNVSIMSGENEVSGFGRKILTLPLDEKGAVKLNVPAGSFSQVNWNINLELIKSVIRHAEPGKQNNVLDLYSGAGNFSLPLARAGAKVVAVESDKVLVSFGKENAMRYSFSKNLSFVEDTVENYLKKKPKADVILADPPRSGLGNLVNHLNFANKLILISCHLPSFIRDTKYLKENSWQLKSIESFDMFAQTSHIETLGVFTKE